MSINKLITESFDKCEEIFNKKKTELEKYVRNQRKILENDQNDLKALISSVRNKLSLFC